MAAITIAGLSKSYGATAVLRDIDLAIADGSFFTLLGPSGCGKTTLLRILAGFVEPDAGRVLFDSDDVTDTPAHQRNIGMVFQDYALFPDKTVFDNVAYGLRARRIPEASVRRQTHEQLERVGLQALATRHPAQLSGGQRQRAALARALVIRPRVLLMDEPLSNLDAKLRGQMRETILDLQRASRITTIFVTHDQDEALSMSDRVAVMDKGSIAQVGDPRDLYQAPVNAYVADFIGAANILPVTVERIDGDRLVHARLNGTKLLCHNGGVQGPGPGLHVSRPEQLTLRGRDAAGGGQAADLTAENVVRGTIKRRSFFGATTRYVVGIDGGLQLTALQHTGAPAQDLEAGDAVEVLLPTTCRVVERTAAES